MVNSKKQHMMPIWRNIVKNDENVAAKDATLKEKATLVGRVGTLMLSVGTGAWRVRKSMNKAAESLGISCSADIGLLAINYTCFCGEETYTQSITLANTGVNTDKLMELENFMDGFEDLPEKYSVVEILDMLDKIDAKKGNYNAFVLGLAAGIACGAFTFLLGGGAVEIICAFFGAAFGNFTRKKLLERHISLFANVGAGVAVACVVYVLTVLAAQGLFGVTEVHRAGYICAMLFVIPGFPLITGGIDLSKLDLRSGLERITYALLIITVATLTGWVTALICKFHPADFAELNLSFGTEMVLRMIASFLGVFNFSLMFNSTKKMAFTAGMIGLVSNTLRLELVDYCAVPAAAGAFIGAFCSGCIASLIGKKKGFPRISLTVPSIVIMVPGMFMYKAIYFMGLNDIGNGALWLTKAALIVISLPLGLVMARICTDKEFRHCN